MVSALGMQRVEVFGTAGDTPMGCLMVEADRHMKQLALGLEPMPEGARNYFDVVEANLDAGVPNDLLLRLWFTSSPRPVRADAERTVFELAGTPVRLSGQNEHAMASGRRGNVTTRSAVRGVCSRLQSKLACYSRCLPSVWCFGIDLSNSFRCGVNASFCWFIATAGSFGIVDQQQSFVHVSND